MKFSLRKNNKQAKNEENVKINVGNIFTLIRFSDHIQNQDNCSYYNIYCMAYLLRSYTVELCDCKAVKRQLARIAISHA